MFTCQARKGARSTVRWPLVSLPLPSRPEQLESFDLKRPLPETNNGDVYVFLIVDIFCRHAEGYAMTKDDKTARGCAAKIVDDYIVYLDGGVPILSFRIGVRNLYHKLVERCRKL